MEDRGEPPVEPLRVMIVPVSPVAVFSAASFSYQKLLVILKILFVFIKLFVLPEVELVRVEAVE